ncbi:MAG: putative LPS assembly protein LptD [Bacteroidales bacterium]
MALISFILQGFSQVNPLNEKKDSLIVNTDTIVTPKPGTKKKDKLEAQVVYSAQDSILFDLPLKKVYLYGEARIQYKDINLKAAFIEINFKDNFVTARGIVDSAGKEIGLPEFSEGASTFKAKLLSYNFDTRKGIISSVITKEGEGYIHGSTIKKISDSVINIRTGKYTTCELEHPHYEFRFLKSKVITDNKIVTGPAYLSVAGVPTPLAVPFGLFPNKKGQRSGLLLPTYGESASRGFYFENFGYYFGLNQFVDLELRADIYTLGSWAAKAASRYAKKYKYSGYFNFNYAMNKIGISGSDNYQNYRDFSVRWVHNQSDKARPNSRFSSNVNVVSSKFNQFNPANTNAYLSNTFQSSISYQTNFNGKYFLTSSLSHSQNTIDKSVSLTLPDISFSVNRFFPFARKEQIGTPKWYEKISVNYQSVAQNSINTYDSLLFKPATAKKFRNGISHSISISNPLKVFKYLVVNNSVSYKERWYTHKINRRFYPMGDDIQRDTLITDTLSGFYAARDISFSSSVSTILYGLVQFKKGPVKGIRHVVTPSVSFSYTPGFAESGAGYYRYYLDTMSRVQRYSVFEGSLYGVPTADNSGRISFSINNNLEIKVRSSKDTINGTRKIPIIENFSIQTSYDLAKDSLRWSPLVMSGRTRLFKDINISYSSAWDPYILDSTGTSNLNRFEWDVNKRIVRKDNTAWTLSINWDFKSKPRSPAKPKDEQTVNELQSLPEQVVDFNVPWSLRVSYSFRYNADINYLNYIPEKKTNIIQTLDFNGDINITPKWKISVRSGYDFKAKELSFTSVDFYRDLHCWEMRFGWIPIGFRKSWNFTINVKSQILQDLRLNKKKDFRDY